MVKRKDVFVPPDGTKPIPPNKDEQGYMGNGTQMRNPPISQETGRRIREALRNTRREKSFGK